MSSTPILLTAKFRSKLEEKVSRQLEQAGVEAQYESGWIRYQVPARDAKYLPDFRVPGSNIIIEAKGRFGHRGRNGAEERQKLILLKQQHPELDIRIIYQDANKPIYKGSKTTYARWSQDNGFQYSDRGIVPKEWIKEMSNGS